MASDGSKDWRMPRSARSLAHRLGRQPLTLLLLVLGALFVARNYTPLGGAAGGVGGAQTQAAAGQAAAIAADLAGVAGSSEAGLSELSAKVQTLEKRLEQLRLLRVLRATVECHCSCVHARGRFTRRYMYAGRT